jgi:Flp pilus assembly protein TadB
MSFIGDMDADGPSRLAVDNSPIRNSAVQYEVSGSNHSLRSALTSIVLVAGALFALWRFPTPWENWLVIGIIGAALVACAVVRYSVYRRESKLAAQADQGSF